MSSVAEKILGDRVTLEADLLALILSGEECGCDALLGLKPDMLHVPKHRTILRACQDVISGGSSIDRLKVVDAVRKIEPEFDINELFRLVNDSGPVDVAFAVKKIRSRWKLDRLDAIAHDVITRGPDVTDSDSFVNETLARIYDLDLSSEKIQIQTGNQVLDEAHASIKRAHDNKGQIGLNVGIPNLNRLICGLQPGYLILIAGRPSIGKTALAINVMEHISVNAQGAPTLFISLEMSAVSLMKRMIAGRMEGTAPTNVNTGRLTKDELIKLDHAINQLWDKPIYIADAPSASMSDISILCKSAVARYGVKAVFVDYLQLIAVPQSMGNRNEQVSFVSRSLKGIARELKIPVVALSQLNRLGDNVRPELSYLRDSGSLEQDADQILFVCRLKLKTEDDVGRLEKDWNIKQEIGELSRMGLIIVGKARNEQTGQVAVEFKPDEIRYVEKKQ
jgi:replicative DNA helicase